MTGGSGYLGRRLVRELVRRGHRTRVLDRRAGAGHDPSVEVLLGDVRSLDDLRRACAGADTVFHCAGVIPLTRLAPRRVRDECRDVNVRGCRNVLEAAVAAGVRRLVYTSSTNVALGTAPPAPGSPAGYTSRPHDLYTATKIAAERMVLAENGRRGLLTCAVRPGGIWGPDDPRIVGRLVDECRRGRMRWLIGDGAARADNTYVDNAVDGHVAAALRLFAGSPACGNAYDVTDGNPANTFEFARPLVEGMGFRMPRRRLPARPLMAAAWVGEALYAAGFPVPPLTTGELRRIVSSDAVAPERTRADLGWRPPIGPAEAYGASLAHCRRLLAVRRAPADSSPSASGAGEAGVDRPHPVWWILLPGGMAALGALVFSASLHDLWSRYVTSWTPRWLLAAVFAWALAVHVYKGLAAARLAAAAGLAPAGWGWQTLLLGFASMRLLRRRIAAGPGRDP